MPLQIITTIGILLSVVFTAYGLVYTAGTLEATRQTQITDRYTKAVEQLGSKSDEVRLGGVYALERISVDSPRDRKTIQDVLAAFVRNGDFCSRKNRLCHSRAEGKAVNEKIPIDVRAAVDRTTTLSNITGIRADFSEVTFPHAHMPQIALARSALDRGNFAWADLSGADLSYATLDRTNFHQAFLSHANLKGIRSTGIILIGAALYRADLRGANLEEPDFSETILEEANLAGSKLMGAHMVDVDLKNAILEGANLRGADLTKDNLDGARLRGAHLEGADLRNIESMTPEQIRKVAITDATTKF
ncbi:pentapeptide repeat-containing protein [Planomonospora sp. ID67723]|uniref:pentapeptide repeat-containing protein n=1 Tax=Planomonospora sp. ID67723 TaxID=2738134 RepID=UPI0018C3810D|nr:pentapeptide repeat-containing protein [Planomonospora sp. ID67723]MBG0831608.1 pentapeptide repeat-containing protein [Planomonospora sp. ID67723]